MNSLEKQLKIIQTFVLVGLIGGAALGLFASGASFGVRIALALYFGVIGLLIGLILPSLGAAYKWIEEKTGSILSSCNPFKGDWMNDDWGDVWKWLKLGVFVNLLGLCLFIIIFLAPFISIKRYFTIKKQLQEGNFDEENLNDKGIAHIRETPQYRIYLEAVEALKQSGYEIENTTFQKELIQSFVMRDFKNYGMIFAVYNAGFFSNGISTMEKNIDFAHKSGKRVAVYWPQGSFVGGFTEDDGFYSFDEKWLNILRSVIG